MIITRLSQHEDLKAIHTIIRSKHSGLPDTAADSNEDVVASIISCSAQQKSRPVIRGKPHRQQFQRQQSLPRSPIMKKTTQRISAAVWAKMSQEARDQLRQENKESQRRQRGGRGGRGRGGSAVQVQRRIANEAEEEVDIAEAGGVQF